MPPPADKSLPARRKRPLILVTHEFFPHRGGIAVYAAEMAKAACAEGYAVEVWAPALPVDATEPDWPFQVHRLNLAGDHSLESQWRMAQHLRKNLPRLPESILYIPEPGPLLALLLLQFFEHVHTAGLVITFHGSEIQRLSARRFLRWSTKHLLLRTARIGVVSEFAGQLLAKHFPVSAGKVVVTPGALRTDLTVPAAPPDRARHGRIVILTVARLNPRKGQLQVIEALKRLPPAQQARLEYRLVGCHSKDNYETLLKTAAEDANFPVKFLGDIPDEKLGAVYADADIFAMTSMPHRQSVEGFGLVYLEAGAHGLPVVAHDIGGVAEAVLHGETGLLVAPGDTSALTAALAQLIDDAALRQRLGAAGRARARAHTWRDCARALFGPLPPPPTATSAS